MTQSDIIKLAIDAHLFDDDQEPCIENLKLFATLAAQAERISRQAAQAENEQLKARLARSGVELRKAVRDERKECEKACEELLAVSMRSAKDGDHFEIGRELGHQECLDAIRARNHIVELNKKVPGLALDSGEFVPADCVGCDCADNEPCRKTDWAAA